MIGRPIRSIRPIRRLLLLMREFHRAVEDPRCVGGLQARPDGQLTVALVGLRLTEWSLPITGHVQRALETLGHEVQLIDHSAVRRSYEVMGALKRPAQPPIAKAGCKARCVETNGP